MDDKVNMELVKDVPSPSEERIYNKVIAQAPFKEEEAKEEVKPAEV